MSKTNLKEVVLLLIFFDAVSSDGVCSSTSCFLLDFGSLGEDVGSAATEHDFLSESWSWSCAGQMEDLG